METKISPIAKPRRNGFTNDFFFVHQCLKLVSMPQYGSVSSPMRRINKHNFRYKFMQVYMITGYIYLKD